MPFIRLNSMPTLSFRASLLSHAPLVFRASLILSTLLFCACSHSLLRTEAAPGPEKLSEPNPIQLEIVVKASVESVLSGKNLEAENVKMSQAVDQKPQLLFWSSDIRNHFGQRGIEMVNISPKPSEVWTDPENGNRIFFWNCDEDIKPGAEITLRRVYRMTLYAYDAKVDSKTLGEYDDSDPRVEFYTKSEPFHEKTEDLQAAADSIVKSEANPWERARLIFKWVRANMTYQYPPPGGRGAMIAFRERKGDCGQYADLFIALCRCAGVPVRFASGFMIEDSKEEGGKKIVGPHAWAEVLLPNGEWVPVDPTGEEETHFGRCAKNTYITAAVGRNISLPNPPDGARYQFSDVEDGRTEFMQSVTQFQSGVKTKVAIERRIIP